MGKVKEMAHNHHVDRFESAIRAHGLSTVLDWLAEAIDGASKHNARADIAACMHDLANRVRGESVAFDVVHEWCVKGGKYVSTTETKGGA